MWYRVFGTDPSEPDPSALLEYLGHGVKGHFHADDAGWFRAELDGAAGQEPLKLERYLATEEGIRQEFNTWAAWVEETGEGAIQIRLMQHLIGTRQLFTFQRPAEFSEERCLDLCRYLAKQCAGIYQVDERGFFDADGRLLLPEDSP
jgi:hypothetical protein